MRGNEIIFCRNEMVLRGNKNVKHGNGILF